MTSRTSITHRLPLLGIFGALAALFAFVAGGPDQPSGPEAC